jgi:CHAT domain
MLIKFIDILIITANPNQTSSLQLEREVKEIQNAISLSKYRDKFRFVSHSAVTSEELRRALLARPQIIHFSGHGLGHDGILLEDKFRNIQIVETEAICKLLEIFSDTIDCVILNACHTDVQAKLISKYIPYVIGMKSAVNDVSALNFSVGFYDAIGAGESFELAYELGCNAIQMLGLPGSEIPSFHHNDRLSTRTLYPQPPSTTLSPLSNLEKQHLQDELCDSNDRFKRLSDKLAFFQKKQDIATSPDVQFQLTHQITEITNERMLVKKRIKEIEDLLQ